MAEGEVKTEEERANELLRSDRLVFLQTAGYTTAQIIGFGNLASLPGETEITYDLLLRKTAR